MRWFVVIGTLALVAVAVMVLGLGFFPAPPTFSPGNGPAPAALGPRLMQTLNAGEQPPAPADVAPVGGGKAGLGLPFGDLLVIPNCHLSVIDKQDVPSKRDGTLLFIGAEVSPEELAKLRPDQVVSVDEKFVYAEAGKDDPEHELVEVNGKKYRRLRDKEEVDPMKLVIVNRTRRLRRLAPNVQVQKGQLLAVVDPSLSIDDFISKRTKVEAAKADWEASVKTVKEAEQRYRTLEKLYGSDLKSIVAIEEVRGGKLTWDRYFYEEIAKREGIKTAAAELGQSLTVLRDHEIRAKIPGLVKAVNKHQGESVKALEPVLLINYHDRLRIEGRVEVQHMAYLQQIKDLVLEPSRPQSFSKILSGHHGEVRGVAVSKWKQIVSASDDGTVRVWDRSTGGHGVLDFKVPMRALACTPPDYSDASGKARNLCLAGGADGVARLIDLDRPNEPPLVFQGKHDKAINAIAFSPAGKWCATAGEDQTIRLWDTDTGALVQPAFRSGGHVGGITSLQFLSRKELVSAGRDKVLVVWTLNDDGALAAAKRFENRSGEVPVLGVNPLTHQVLFDQGKELRIYSLPGPSLEGVLQNSSDAMPFGIMALFSPDGSLILTANASEGRLQLWKAPTAGTRAYELRQLISPFQSTCGAFSPMEGDDNFVVTGGDRQVVVWALPSKEEVGKQLKATVEMVEPSLDSTSREVRIWAEIDNSDHALIPGLSATLVAYPNK